MNDTHRDRAGKAICPQSGAAGKQADGDRRCGCFELLPVLPIRPDTFGLCSASLTQTLQEKERQL